MTTRRITPCTVAATLAVFAAPLAVGQAWEDEFAVTQDPVLQYRSYLAVDPDDFTYVLWPDWADPDDTRVTLTRSDDLGRTWSAPAVIFDGEPFDNFDLQADASGLHLVLVDFRETPRKEFKELYYTRSTDRGLSFSTPVRIGGQQNVEAVKLFTVPGKLFLYARNYKNDVPENFLFVSEDDGATWTEKTLLAGAILEHPDFAHEGGVLHMVYRGVRLQPEILHRTSSDDGDSWSSPVSVDTGFGSHSQLPAIALDDQAIHVTWEDDRSDHFNVRYARSTDGGATFEPAIRLNQTFYGARARLLANESGLHVLWCQYHGDNGWPPSWGSGDYGIVWARSSLDSGVSWSPELRVSQNDAIPNDELPDKGANHVEVAPYRTGFCALWQDRRDGNFDLYMRDSLALAADGHEVTLAGGTVRYRLDAGPARAGRGYVVLGTVTGTRPGLPLPGGQATLPINYDLFTGYVIQNLNSTTFTRFLDTFDASGTATAELHLPAIPPQLVGLVMNFACATSGPWDFASNPAAVEIVP